MACTARPLQTISLSNSRVVPSPSFFCGENPFLGLVVPGGMQDPSLKLDVLLEIEVFHIRLEVLAHLRCLGDRSDSLGERSQTATRNNHLE